MKQFRAVFQYRRGLTRGAGAAFVIAVDEVHARAQFALDMPGAELRELLVEPEPGPLAQYERPPLKLVPRPECIGCDEPTCEKCVREKAQAARKAKDNGFAERWS